ncbi:MAG: zinc ribbon domain-containing protein [Thermodesulfobacteriota bacterium]|nr:zinc ribbon domain-containing protein [Thermodesulfobacteriota bacterium]
MPIYEFYCADCNTIFNFFSSRVNTEKRPMCPKCGSGPLDRLMSRFAVLKGAKAEDDVGMPDLDESKLEKAMSVLEREAENLNEDDPRQGAKLMRKLCDMTGLDLGSGMEEALKRMEAGEDPEQIEKEMGDILDGGDFLDISSKATPAAKKRPPVHDENLYYL